jgi:hypothetical protein
MARPLSPVNSLHHMGPRPRLLTAEIACGDLWVVHQG